ncbi:MAG: response regulator [Chloroflexota bacterium]
MKTKAIVIEDDVTLAQVFCEALNHAGYDPTIFNDGQDALENLAQDTKPYLIVLDLHLPNVSGAEILRFIRSEDELKETKVIVASADGTLATTPEIEQFATFLLQKPVRFSQLQMLAKRLHPDR